MKRKLVLCLIVFVSMQLVTHIQALEFSNTVSVGEVGIDTNFRSIALSAHLINFTIQDESGFGIQITPVRALLDLQTIGFTAVTFVNTIAYYDFFKYKDEILLGPFVSINTVNAFKIDSIECHVGLLFTFRTFEYEFSKHTVASSDWLTIRTGYEYHDGERNFYIQIGVDLLTTVTALAISHGEQNQGINKGY